MTKFFFMFLMGKHTLPQNIMLLKDTVQSLKIKLEL